MRVYIAGATSARQYVKSYRSYTRLRIKPDDLLAEPEDFAPGEVARIRFGEDFLKVKKEYDAILLLDLDMELPPDLLERLRAHDLDMVTGHYFKRGHRPMMSVCSVGDWPFTPLYDVPESGLHEISNTGLGCVLIKREVVEAVAETFMPGEQLFTTGPLLDLWQRDFSRFGSDYRFFAKARSLGYKLWLDASLECAHGSTIWLTRKLYDILRPHQYEVWQDYFKSIIGMRKDLGMDREAAELRIKQLRLARAQIVEQISKVSELEDQLKVIDGQLAERELDMRQESGPKKLDVPVLTKEELERRQTNRGKGPSGEDRDEVAAAREEVYKKEAEKVIDALQDE